MSANLSKYISPYLIFTDLDFAGKEELFQNIINRICSIHKAIPKNKVMELILNREKSSTTDLGNGIAVPHCRLEGSHDVVVAFGISKTGICFGANKKKPVHFVFFVIGSEKTADEHLFVLAQIAKLMSSGHVKKSLIELSSPSEIYNLIQSLER